MKVVCAWCNKVLSPGETGDRVSHGICPECRYGFFVRRKLTLNDLLNQFDVPVIAIDSNGVALHANAAAAKLLDKTAEDVKGLPVGNVVECIHAHTPEGCGRTIHCAGCAIRHAVTATHQDGQPRRNIEAEKLVRDAGGTRLARFTFSTEKTGGVVLLMIEDRKILAPEVEAMV